MSIIFDLDGVLFDGCEFHAKMFIEAYCSVLGKTALTKEYHDKYLNGLSTKKKLEVLGISKEDTQKISDIKQDLTRKNIINNIRPDLKVQEICKTLINQGYKIYCVSNSIRETLIKCLEGMGVLPFFSGIISNEDVKEPLF
jgi:beta-phosphoglucomutase-like phosphatase (HAD superfamily)